MNRFRSNKGALFLSFSRQQRLRKLRSRIYTRTESLAQTRQRRLQSQTYPAVRRAATVLLQEIKIKAVERHRKKFKQIAALYKRLN